VPSESYGEGGLLLFTELPRRVLLGNRASDAYDSRNLAQPRSLKNRQFASCAGALKCVGLVAVAGLVDAVNYYHPARRFFYNGGGI
jgi:hypothetical protein